MRRKKFLIALSPLLLLLSSCGFFQREEPTPITVTETVYVYNELEVKERPKGVNMHTVRFRVVSDENLEEFLEEIKNRTGETVFIALRIRDYEKLALNVAELKRFIQQQQNLILYYEDIIEENNKNIKD